MRKHWVGISNGARIGLVLTICLVAISVVAGNQRAMIQLKPAVVCAGHTDLVRGVSFLPDGKHLVSAADDSTAQLWDLETGECLHVFAGHAKTVRAVAVSHDGKRFATASDDGTARIWDIASGDQLSQFEGHAGAVRGVAFLPVGQLITVGFDGTLRIWRIETEEQIWMSEAEDGGNCLAITPDGRRAVYGGRTGIAHAWDLVTRKKIGDYGEECGCKVTTVAISPDGQRIYVAVSDKSAAAYKADGGEKIPAEKGIFDPGAMGLSPDGKIIASLHHVNDAQTGRRLCDPAQFLNSLDIHHHFRCGKIILQRTDEVRAACKNCAIGSDKRKRILQSGWICIFKVLH